MPTVPTYPGVYIEEVPSPVRAIPGVSTSRTAFVGRAKKGPLDTPVSIKNFGDFERAFGGLWIDSTMSYSIRHYFQNGGTDALVVRIANEAVTATATLATDKGDMVLTAANEGAWGNNLRVLGEPLVGEDSAGRFNLKIEETDGSGTVLSVETHLNLSTDPRSPRYALKVLEGESKLARIQATEEAFGTPNAPESASGDEETDAKPEATPFDGGSDGNPLGPDQFRGSEAAKTGMYALEHADLFNLMVIPPPTRSEDHDPIVWGEATTYCSKRRAMLILDAPSSWKSKPDAIAGMKEDAMNNLRSPNSIFYFPRLQMADPLLENRLETFAPSGVVAGVIARTDASRGFWKAPAGQDAGMNGVRGLAVRLTDAEQGDLNPIGLNCFRSFPVAGTVVWGARTSKGADQLASQWKYVPVRRTALYIEESLYRGTQWVVFEPNDEPLWSQIRLNVGTFMHDLFRKGAFQGGSPKDAYFVKCDAETTTQDDIDKGIVNILVGFAPLKPAEFVVIKISQITNKDQ